jgi:hypothetical protein
MHHVIAKKYLLKNYEHMYGTPWPIAPASSVAGGDVTTKQRQKQKKLNHDLNELE